MRSEFAAARPHILGAIFEALACGLRRQEPIKLSALPRMADACRWVEACAPALGWKQGTFVTDLLVSERASAAMIADNDPLALALLDLFMDTKQTEWRMAELYRALGKRVGEDVRNTKHWPRGSNALSGRLKRLDRPLRAKGLSVQVRRDDRGARVYLSSLPSQKTPS